jgi:arginine decarboxylase
MPMRTKWTTEKSAETYALNMWGKDFFDISDDGEVRALLREGDEVYPVSMFEVIQGLRERGFDLPLLLRFPDFLETRIRQLNETFRSAMQEVGFKGDYRGVYPIKVNQQDQVIEAITRFGRQYNYGLEAGSKAELIAALSYMHDPEAYIVCNGYKDEEFIDLALYANQLGLRCILVIEMPEELPLILSRADALGIDPMIGVRIKLTTESSGHWNDSGGDRSVFGLTISQLVDLIDRLKAADRLDTLKLLHYHQGSQIPNIRSIREAASEAARVYVNLVQEGAPMGILDIGGGLAVDYDGSKTNFQASCNYSIREYCVDVIEAIMGVLNQEDVAHPTIISESGRAIVAHCSVLLFNVFEVTRFVPQTAPEKPGKDDPEMLRYLYHVYDNLNPKNIQEAYNDAVYYRQEIINQFKTGVISMRDRARGDHIFWNVVASIAKEAERAGRFCPPDLVDLGASLVDIYHVNFSVFQSLPDAWAIDQLFPIMPIHRLTEEPKSSGIMADITCDCDGKMDKFIDFHGVKRALPLHDLRENEDYVLGAFLVGAYQETLGDLHNLLGDTNVVSMRIEDGELFFEREQHGDSIADVLSYVEYDPKQLTENFRTLAERAVRHKRISPQQRRTIMRAFEEGLRSYTYFRD